MPPAEPLVVGVLALQGDVAEHLRALEGAGARPLAVRTPADLDEAAGLIIPGGESTTIWKLAELFELAGPLRMRVASVMPVFGSCAGMIMLAGRLADPASGQQTLAAIDMTIRRNAFGRQVDSFESELSIAGSTAARTAACSSAPRGPSGWAGTPRPSPPSRAPVRSSRSGRDRRWPPPSTPS